MSSNKNGCAQIMVRWLRWFVVSACGVDRAMPECVDVSQNAVTVSMEHAHRADRQQQPPVAVWSEHLPVPCAVRHFVTVRPFSQH